MEKVSKIIQSIVFGLFGIEQSLQLSRPDSKFGDYSTNIAMQLAKPLGKKPREVAEILVEKLQETGLFSEISIAGPGFINLRVSGSAAVKTLNESWSSRFGENNDGAGKTVIVEYPSLNVAKPYSIGHLRSGNQGWAAKRLMEATGWKVVTDNHLGDYGSPFGIWVVGFLRYSSEEKLDADGVYELGRVYIDTKKALKDEEANGSHELADQVQDWLLKLENNDPEAVAYREKFNTISLKHMHEIMGRLKISTDYELGEAFFVPKGKAAIQELLDKNIATQNPDGSIIVDLKDYGFDVPLLVQKSNGAALYATSDLATILYREDTWHPDRVIYAVGGEQQFYFRQIFAMAKKLGIQTDLIHLWFGTIDQINDDGTRGKMSSRKGVVLMEELLNQAEAKAREVVRDREVDEEDIKKIALGAIKFSDFVADRRTNILFSWDTIFALSGFSGPYVQYAAVRVNKILSSNEIHEFDINAYDFESEKQVIMKILEYPEVINIAARDLEPHKVATYLYELARDLNRYYESTPVATGDVTETEKQARLSVLSKASYVFSHGLSLLGIEVPTRM